MKAFSFRLAYLAAGASVVLMHGPAFAALVETPPGSVSGAQVSVTMDNDWQFLDSNCFFIPVLATYGREDDAGIVGELTVTKPGFPAIANEATFLILPGDPTGGQVLDEVFICPEDGTGEYQLNTLVLVVEPEGEQSFTLDPLTFWVRPAISRMSALQIRSSKAGTQVSGIASAGEGFATGVVDIRTQRPGSSKWSRATRVDLDKGRFEVTLQPLARGSRVQATLSGCRWCSRTSATGRVR